MHLAKGLRYCADGTVDLDILALGMHQLLGADFYLLENKSH